MAEKTNLVYDLKRGFLLATRQRVSLRASPVDIASRRQPTMSDPNPPPSISALVYSAGGLTNDILMKFADLDFNEVATPWEQKWSSLCNGGGTFKPVLVETTELRQLGMGTVSGHRGTVANDSLVQYGSPSLDRNTGWLGGDGIVFVVDKAIRCRPANLPTACRRRATMC